MRPGRGVVPTDGGVPWELVDLRSGRGGDSGGLEFGEDGPERSCGSALAEFARGFGGDAVVEFDLLLAAEAMDVEAVLASEPLGEVAAFAHTLRVTVVVNRLGAVRPAHGLDELDACAWGTRLEGAVLWLADSSNGRRVRVLLYS